MLGIVVYKNMKLEDNTLNNERLSLLKRKFATKKSELQSLFYCFNYKLSIILKLFWEIVNAETRNVLE